MCICSVKSNVLSSDSREQIYLEVCQVTINAGIYSHYYFFNLKNYGDILALSVRRYQEAFLK